MRPVLEASGPAVPPGPRPEVRGWEAADRPTRAETGVMPVAGAPGPRWQAGQKRRRGSDPRPGEPERALVPPRSGGLAGGPTAAAGHPTTGRRAADREGAAGRPTLAEPAVHQEGAWRHRPGRRWPAARRATSDHPEGRRRRRAVGSRCPKLRVRAGAEGCRPDRVGARRWPGADHRPSSPRGRWTNQPIPRHRERSHQAWSPPRPERRSRDRAPMTQAVRQRRSRAAGRTPCRTQRNRRSRSRIRCISWAPLRGRVRSEQRRGCPQRPERLRDSLSPS
jgi:hypothetical protein